MRIPEACAQARRPLIEAPSPLCSLLNYESAGFASTAPAEPGERSVRAGLPVAAPQVAFSVSTRNTCVHSRNMAVVLLNMIARW